MSPLHIAYVITGLGVGGAETVLYKLLSRLRLRSTVISLMPCEGLPLERQIRALGIEVYSLGVRPGRPSPRAFIRLARKLRALKPDLISGWEVHGNVAAACGSYFQSGPPMIWNVCGSLDNLSTEKLATRMLIHSLAWVAARPKRIIYKSEISARQHEGIGYCAARTAVIPNGFDCELFRPDSGARAGVRREIGLQPDALLIGMIARYHPVKDHDTFLQAAQRLAEVQPYAHFLLAGGGVCGENSELSSRICELGLADRVSLLGERQDIPRITAALDVACLTSLAEGFPNVIGEAMACGVPCVATGVGDVACIVGETGRLAPPGNPEAFAVAVGQLLALPAERRQELGARARQRVLDRYDLDRITRAFEGLYRDVVEEAVCGAAPLGRSRPPGRLSTLPVDAVRPTRVLHVLGDSTWGGGSVGILAMAEAGLHAGWSVDLLTTDPTTIEAARQRGLGVVNLDVIRRSIRPWRDLKGLWRLSAFLKNGGYDLVHTHTSKAGFVGRIAATLARVPVIVHTMHGFAIHEASPAVEQLAYAGLEKLAARCCHSIVTVSHFHRRWALDLGIASEQKLVAIPNGVLERPAVTERERVRKSLGLASHHVAILSTSRMAAGKGLEDLIRAVKLLSSEIAGRVKILFAGEGALQDTLEQMTRQLGVEHAVRFLGFRSDIPDLLAASDIVALPSLREGLSMALLEAMAAGKPVIATAIGGIREATKNGQCAVLVPVRDVTAIAAAITELVVHPDRAACLGQRGREIYVKEYTVQQMTAQYLRLYQELISERLRRAGFSPRRALARPRP